jgi:hypothetical protein
VQRDRATAAWDDGHRTDDLIALLADHEAELRRRDGQIQLVIEAVVELLEAIGDLPDRRWARHAACKGETQVMFPARGESHRPAQDLCFRCWVADECAAWLATVPHQCGVVAGTSERQRRAARRVA